MKHADCPNVSVIISTYNRPALLDRALGSVLAQTYDDFEVVIVDDCSPPTGVEFPEAYKQVLEKYGEAFDKRGIDLWAYRLGENSGYQCMPKNRGIEKSRGNYIAYLDDDNTWRPEHLQTLVSAIESDFSHDMVYSRVHYEISEEKVVRPVHASGRVCQQSVEDDRASRKRACKLRHTDHAQDIREVVKEMSGGAYPEGDGDGVEWDPNRLAVMNYIDTSCMLHSKGAFWRLVRETDYGWDESLRRFGDWNFVWRWSIVGNNAKLVDAVTVNYNVHPGSLQMSRPLMEVPVCLGYNQYQLNRKDVRTECSSQS